MTPRALVAAALDGRWAPGIGDPTVMGWVTVLTYFAAAGGCVLAAWRDPHVQQPPRSDSDRRLFLMGIGIKRARSNPPEPADAHRRPSLFWLSLAAAMLALGINKQLDLQSLATQIGRDIIKEYGLYEVRGNLQKAFIATVAAFCAMALGAGLWLARGRLRSRWPAIVGIMFLLGFVIIRAASFHNVDAFLMGRLGRVKWNWILELGGIAWIIAGVVRACPPPADRPSRRSPRR